MEDMSNDDKREEKDFGEERVFDDDLMARHFGDVAVFQCMKCGKVIGIMKRKGIKFYAKMVRDCSHLKWQYIPKDLAEEQEILFDILVSHAIFGAIGKKKYYLLFKLPEGENEEEENQES